MPARSGESGQSTVEWIGLILVVSLVVAAAAAAFGVRVPGRELARLIAQRIVCAAGIGADCLGLADPELVAEYGPELAELVRERAPTLVYEAGMIALPVDFRECREVPCSVGRDAGRVERTADGLPATLFVRIVDCRGEAPHDEPVDCSGARAGQVYLQYWAYYPESESLSRLPGDIGYHRDDWESFQLRIGSDGRLARASSHHGYNGEQGSWRSDLGWDAGSSWTPDSGTYFVSGGSHAGRVGPASGFSRWTPSDRLRLIPIERIARGHWAETAFEVTPPWLKQVYLDPESEETD